MAKQTTLFENKPKVQTFAALMRPKNIEEVHGQEHVTDYIRRVGENIPHLILMGPPGTGKTTLAHAISNFLDAEFLSFNAVTSGIADLKKLIEPYLLNDFSKKVILFIDEVHRFNKAQQDFLLPYLEEGPFIFIGATTENPRASLNNAIVSRVKIFTLKPHTETSLLKILETAQKKLNKPELERFIPHLVKYVDGDSRIALNVLHELSMWDIKDTDKTEDVLTLVFKRVIKYDLDGNRHYDVISAFIKSIRGSDPDAAVLWLAIMLEGGEEPEFIARRLMILASEDIGLANSQGLQVATNAHYAVKTIGMPEARIILSHATIFLALAPKSNSAYNAINSAVEFVQKEAHLEVPSHLKNFGPDKEKYKYAHSYPNHWVEQKYFADKAEVQKFYVAGDIGSEKSLFDQYQALTKKKNNS